MTHTLSRRDALKLTGAVAALGLGTTQLRAQDQTVRLIVITPPGAIVDASSRKLAEGLRVRLGRPVIVENKTGAGGNIATDFVAKSAPDGTTLLVTSNNHTTNAALYKKLSYDAERDLIPVTHTVDFALVLAANPTLQASNLAELIALAKKKPESLSYGSGGNGSPGHIAMELLLAQTGLRLQHIPYKGASPAMTDAMAGQLPLAAGSLSSALPFIKSGQLKAIGVSGKRRSPSAPNIPTFIESGVKEYDYTGWIGLMAPRGTPANVVKSLHEHISAVIADPAYKQTIESMGGEVVQQPTIAFAQMLAQDFERNRALVKSAGLHSE
jgi:tripartite-type tricarboxylate transporter receptor subunit TctC